jgi:putative ABC transport system permease protein
MPTILNIWLESIFTLKLMGRRSLLALIGVTVGSAAIVALLDIGQSASAAALRMFQGMGASLIVITFPAGPVNTVALSDLKVPDLRRNVAELRDFAPVSINSVGARHHGHTANVYVVGTTSQLSPAIGLRLAAGRLLSGFDRNSTFAVVGSEVWRDFGETQPMSVGDSIELGGYLYTVVGILHQTTPNPLIPVDTNHSVVLPIEGLRRVQPTANVNAIITTAVDGSDLVSVSAKLKRYMEERLHGRDVDMRIPQQLLDAMKKQAQTFSYLLAGIGAIALLVGGVGVMNVMLMSVTERRREIGIRMAIGARARDIRSLFLFEAINLSAVGAIVGVVVGTVTAYVFCQFSGWGLTIAPLAAPLGAVCSIASGLFFGVYPAISAASLKPVEALRDA